ncbi:MAG: hypothetical protein B5M56_04210 [Desulfococcus sp. 4484_241]|nr:MAG: hypothetical protein B5M56_04210 [Desulfococcus sp. 4484_241]
MTHCKENNPIGQMMEAVIEWKGYDLPVQYEDAIPGSIKEPREATGQADGRPFLFGQATEKNHKRVPGILKLAIFNLFRQ